MADERVMSIIEFIKNKYPNPDLSEFPDKFAVQIELKMCIRDRYIIISGYFN